MERYHAALTTYVRGSSLRRLGEPYDIVGGFFAERVCRPGFLPAWRASGLPLRRWMMTGVNLYGKSLVRERTRDRLRGAGDAMSAVDGNVDDMGLGTWPGPRFERNLDDPKAHQFLDDQPDIRFGGPIITNFARPWPP